MLNLHHMSVSYYTCHRERAKSRNPKTLQANTRGVRDREGDGGSALLKSCVCNLRIKHDRETTVGSSFYKCGA